MSLGRVGTGGCGGGCPDTIYERSERRQGSAPKPHTCPVRICRAGLESSYWVGEGKRGTTISQGLQTPPLFPSSTACSSRPFSHHPLPSAPYPSHHPLSAPLPVTSGKMKLFFVRFCVLVRQISMSIALCGSLQLLPVARGAHGCQHLAMVR